ENRGFAAGNNAAAALASGEFVVLLNADTMVTPGWLGRLLRPLSSLGIGLVCPVTNFAGNEAKINVDYTKQHEMEQFATRLARKHRGQTLDIAAAPLFCAALRRDLYEKLGGLDESFGIGMFEDDDLSMKVKNQGLRVVVAEDCFVHHFGQGSFAKLPSSEYDRIFETNRRQFEAKWKQSWT